MKTDDEPHVPDWQAALHLANAAPRCGAFTRSRTFCQGPAMPNGRCRFHGGKSTGPRTIAGLERCRRAKLKHGLRSAEATAQRERVMVIRREIKALIAEAKGLWAAK